QPTSKKHKPLERKKPLPQAMFRLEQPFVSSMSAMTYCVNAGTRTVLKVIHPAIHTDHVYLPSILSNPVSSISIHLCNDTHNEDRLHRLQLSACTARN
ncbi:MAG: hypothetical protein ACHQ1H_05510, partial [Nitrososphaerales archaeon]